MTEEAKSRDDVAELRELLGEEVRLPPRLLGVPETASSSSRRQPKPFGPVRIHVRNVLHPRPVVVQFVQDQTVAPPHELRALARCLPHGLLPPHERGDLPVQDGKVDSEGGDCEKDGLERDGGREEEVEEKLFRTAEESSRADFGDGDERHAHVCQERAAIFAGQQRLPERKEVPERKHARK
eukprot:758458-Hanusia_phi.AAC.6